MRKPVYRRVRTLFMSAGFFLGLSALAAISYSQSPLYSSNQNQYFIHGLARAGLGFLKDDWFTHTLDYTPLFSFLVALTYRYGHETLFYLYYALLVGLYVYGLLGIVSFAVHAGDSRLKRWIALVVIVIIHSVALGVISQRALHVNLAFLLTHGVAGHSIPGNVLQPNLFGVLLVWSIRTFLYGGPIPALVYAALAATIHPTYLLAAGALGSSYVFQEFRNTKSLRSAARLGLVASALLLPIVAYVYASTRPTSPEAFALAGHILADIRNPRHMLLATGLGPATYIKIMLVLGAIFLVRRTPLFTVLVVSLLMAAGVTAAYAVSRSSTLALIYPWRLSVYLVPIASSIVLVAVAMRVVDAATRRGIGAQRLLLAVSGLAVLVAVLGGLAVMTRDFERMEKDRTMPVMRFVAETKTPGDVFLVPLDLEMFRIRSGAPIFIDWKSVPLKDTDVLEWYKRVKMAETFYRLRGEEACPALSSITREYAITHVVVEGHAAPSGCLAKLYDDRNYGVYRVIRKGSIVEAS